MKKNFYILLLLTLPFFVRAQEDTSIYERYEHSKLTHQMTPEEMLRRDEIGRGFVATDPPVGPVLNIAEFQPMQGVMIRYPLGIPVSLVKTFSELVKVTVIVSASQQNAATNAFNNAGANMDNIEFMNAASDSYWTRDYGPWFVIDGNDEFGIVDFPYNRPRPNDNNIASAAAGYYGVNLFGMNLTHTGGNYMTDGHHVSSSTTLVQTENPSLTLTQINQKMKDYLGIEAYHLFEDPQGEYIEHIDCWGKFLDVDKILIAQVAASNPRYEIYEEIAETFANTETPWGNKYQVYRVYAPGGYSQPTPYTNSLILNDHVFVPQTGSQHDAAAIAVYQEAMPGYTIVPVMHTSGATWLDTDALHCRTREIADMEMLLIQHYPLLGEQEPEQEYAIYADITAYSGESFVTDSMLIFYKINDSDWKTRPLVHQSGKTWKSTIPCLSEDAEISYYIFAKDESGRRECHPYIGRHDPHIFQAKVEVPPVPVILVEEDGYDEALFNTEDYAYSFTITNDGCENLDFEITVTGGEYPAKNDIVIVEPNVGEVLPNGTATIKITVSSEYLPAGSYQNSIEILSNDPLISFVEIPFDMNVYDGLTPPDTIWIDAKISDEVLFTVTSDFEPELNITEVTSDFTGTITPVEASLPMPILKDETLQFQAIYEGSYMGRDTLYFDCTFVTDLMERAMTIAYIADTVEVESISEIAAPVSVYPNPATNSVVFSFEANNTLPTKIQIFDMMGKLVEELDASGRQSVHWNFSEKIASGVYFYLITNGKERVGGKLVVK